MECSGGLPHPVTNENRQQWADIAKGIAILLVVINHTGSGIFGFSPDLAGPGWTYFKYLTYTFMVPVFFVFSGWFTQLSRRNLPQRGEVLVANIVYPYLLWMLIQGLVSGISKAGNMVVTWEFAPQMIIGGWLQFWFLQTLIILFALDILYRWLGVTPRVRICVAAAVSACVAMGVLPVWWWLQNFVASLIYFEVGVLLALVPFDFWKRLNKVSVFIVSSIALVTLLQLGAGYRTPLRMLGAFAGIASCVSLAVLLQPWRLVAKPLAAMGRCSLEIYVIHVMVSASFRVAFLKLGITNFAFNVVVGSVAAVLIPMGVVYLEARLKIPLFRGGNWLRLFSGRKALASGGALENR